MQCNIGRQSDRCPATRRVSTHNTNLIRTSHNRDHSRTPQRSRYFLSFVFNCRPSRSRPRSSTAYCVVRTVHSKEKARCTLARCDGGIHRQSPIIPRRPPSPPCKGANRPDNPGHPYFSLRVPMATACGGLVRAQHFPLESWIALQHTQYDYPLRRAM